MITTIDYTHPIPEYRAKDTVSVYLTIADTELVAGAEIDLKEETEA